MPPGETTQRVYPHKLATTIMMMLTWLIVAFSGEALAQLNPIQNFCRRFGHQTAIIDRRLYIDGGFMNYNPLSQYPTNYSNTQLFYEDLDVPTANGMPQLYANLTKNDSIPNVNGGTLWADTINKRFYLFGGEFQGDQPPPTLFTLWSFDTLNLIWESFGQPTQTIINGVSYGAGVSVSERGEGYYYGGWMSSNSISGWGSGPAMATSTLIRYDMDSNSWTNSTGPADGIRRAEGSMVFLPISDGGMLVYLGGVRDMWRNGTVVGQPMDEILLYDVLSSKWYTQKAGGTVPHMRRRFCMGAAWAKDQSSYNIYLFGGASISSGGGFDDVYILTIPTFQWIKLWPSDNDNATTGTHPHHSLTCNVVNAQMLIMGGTFPTTNDCDAPNQFGTHNLDLGEQNPNHADWNLYQPNITEYVVPKPILNVIGGSGDGSATKTAPLRGYGDSDLNVLLTRTAKIPDRTPTRDVTNSSNSPNNNKSSTLSTGAIVGISIGAFLVTVSLMFVCFHLFKKHRQKNNPPHPAVLGELSANPDLSHPWTPNTSSAAYTPTIAHPTSPFIPRHPSSPNHNNSEIYTSPVELEAPPPGTTSFFHPGDGRHYELAHGGYPSPLHPTTQNITKIDSEGRVWVQVHSPTATPSLTPVGLGVAGGGSPVHIAQELSTDGTGTGTGTSRSGGEEDTGQWGIGGGGGYRDSSRSPAGAGMSGGSPGGAGGQTGEGSPRHLTYYHP